ncbi:MAG: Membrane protein [Parcubacteria group bacterium GW2011_GWD2_38_11]|nr:MAG: Membrane protein [Parcubacteria group bacterium GW2011_GWD2_38_11]
MKINKKQKNKFTLISVLLALSLGVIFAYAQKGSADESIAQIDEDKKDETQEKIEELEKKADIYREIIDIKRKQSSTLNNQLSITDTNIQQVQTEIDASTQQINEYNTKIIRLSGQIKEKEKIIENQKKLLTNLMQFYYESTQRNPINAYLTDGNFASFLITKDQLSQTGDKIKKLVDSVTDLKIELEVQSSEIDKQKTEIVNVHQKLQDQNDDLQSVKDQRESLLAQTKGEEARYAKMLARVEQQKQELLNIDQLFLSGNFSVGGLSIVDYMKKNEPSSSSFASTSWFFSQKDPRWADSNIGNSQSDMKNWGCAVTSVAMVAKFHGDDITPGLLAKKPIFSSDLINWEMGGWSGAKIELASYGSSHSNIKWSVIDSELSKKHPVIIYIGKTGGKGGHYIVIHAKESKTGKYVVHDPYFGPNIYLDTTRALVGAMGINTSTYMDQMIIYN